MFDWIGLFQTQFYSISIRLRQKRRILLLFFLTSKRFFQKQIIQIEKRHGKKYKIVRKAEAEKTREEGNMIMPWDL